MTEVEEAYETLGLTRGASLRQVDEAYRDLRALWDPERFSDNPRLRTQAREKKRKIEEAYETIITHLSQTTGRKATLPPEKFSETASNAASNRDHPSANLFDDAFSDRIRRHSRRIPVGAIGFLAVLAVLLLTYLTLNTSRERADAFKVSVQEEEDSELTKVVEEVRGRYSESSAKAPVADNPVETLQPPTSLPETKIETPPVKSDPQPAEVQPPERAPPSSQVKSPVRKPPVAKPQEVEATPSLRPLLLRDEISGEDDNEPQQPEDGPSDEQLDVFKMLLKGSPTANQLVKGEIGTLNFAEWSIIQQTPSETWIDLVATWASGQEVHFFWAVKTSSGEVRPLNQAARNLESSMR